MPKLSLTRLVSRRLRRGGTPKSRTIPCLCIAASATWASLLSPAQAADLPVRKAAAPPVQFETWTYRVTPYLWALSLDGTSTIKGRSMDVDLSFIDLLHREIPKQLFAVMSSFEARYGRFALLGDFVYAKLGDAGNGARFVQVRPEIGGGVSTVSDMSMKMAIAEAAIAYEVARWGANPGMPGSGTAVDLYGGGRFWWQQVEAEFAISGTLNIADLKISRGRAVASSGSITWIDPVVGGRIRHQFAPGHDFVLSGDVGGFGVGSKFSWQTVAAYNFDFPMLGRTWNGMIGYRALSVDYSRGAGNTLYEYDMLMHGPVMGVNLRF
ncbi:MAG: hypothetical protein AB7F51_00200 [Pseudorhodoplanes sp.]